MTAWGISHITALGVFAVVAGLLPWILLGAFLAFRVRLPRPLPGSSTRHETGAPHRPMPRVSVVVPARNEAANIERCVASLAAQRYPDFEIIVVDDGSTDGTGELARKVPLNHAGALRVVPGTPLPPGWFGKPWACMNGAREADGDVLLFTDADTTHHPRLLARAVAGLHEDRADALSLVGRQEMGTFGERLVQPQIFALLGMRYHSLDRVIGPDRWKDAIANGQYILVRRAAYDALGGHATVRGEVVEDLRLAQELARMGGRLTVRGAVDLFSTRMYTSLADLVNGWTKNMAVGARQAGGWWGRGAIPALVVFLLVAWVLPAATLVVCGLLALAGTPPSAGLLAWSALATFFTTSIWLGAYPRLGAPAGYALLHPLGALVVAFIALRSWTRGSRRIEWKGRRYAEADAEGEAGGDAGGDAEAVSPLDPSTPAPPGAVGSAEAR
ncbi:hydroxychlorobactene glucosyltransferase CruC [soil metagenome]